MAERNNSEGFTKLRPVLGDLTNRLGKRGSSEGEISGDKSFNFNYNDEDLAKRICVSSGLCTEINSLKENVVLSISIMTDGNRACQAVSKSSNDIETNHDDYFLKGKNAVIGNSKVRIGNKNIEILGLGEEIDVSQSVNKLDVDKDLVDSFCENGHFNNDALPNMNEKSGENFKRPNLTDLEVGKPLDSITTEALLKKNEISEIAQSKFASLKGNVCHLKGNVFQSVDIKVDAKLSDTFPADESKASPEGSQSDVSEYHHAGNFVLSQCGSIDCTILPESQESAVFGVDKFMEMKNGNECAYMDGGTDSIKVCSCPFCTKAGYIWLDLNYQDIKARLSALRKSQKEASILAESFTRVSKIESDLTTAPIVTIRVFPACFIFTHTFPEQDPRGLPIHYCSKEARLLPLNDLRDKCKTDLELIGAARFRGF